MHGLNYTRDRLQTSRLYFVCDARSEQGDLQAILAAALDGGAEIIQLRDKSLPAAALLEAAATFRRLADRHGALFVVNDDPELAIECGADGVHVGQDDASPAQARSRSGGRLIVGLSTHSPRQLAAAQRATGDERPDYVSVGPVWATPTKPGRPAAGLDYVRHAAAEASLPWFAIGGIDSTNLPEVIAAGAARAVVVRAIRDSSDPAEAARALAKTLDRAN